MKIDHLVVAIHQDSRGGYGFAVPGEEYDHAKNSFPRDKYLLRLSALLDKLGEDGWTYSLNMPAPQGLDIVDLMVFTKTRTD